MGIHKKNLEKLKSIPPIQKPNKINDAKNTRHPKSN